MITTQAIPTGQGGNWTAFDERVYVRDGASRGGTYVLRIRVARDLELAFGRFKGGKTIPLQAGDYLYVGSALNESGATCLARRLVRHGSRTAEKHHHPTRESMLAVFPQIGLGTGELTVRNGKNLKWNVDHLLDHPAAELVAVYAIRSTQRVEFAVGELLAADPGTVVFERGLGANDTKNGTHLLRVDASDDWWETLPEKLDVLLADCVEA